jgi:hypothetical protein
MLHLITMDVLMCFQIDALYTEKVISLPCRELFPYSGEECIGEGPFEEMDATIRTRIRLYAILDEYYT